MNNTNVTQTVRTLIIRFKNDISKAEIKYFRGAVIHAMSYANILFHNHQEDGGFRYSYPLIQYKRINGRAAIVCLGEGTDVIEEFFAAQKRLFTLGSREVNMEIENIIPQKIIVQIWDSSFKYHLRKWLPLNSGNYQKYLLIESLSEKISFLENILIANILSFTKGINIHLDKTIECKILSSSEPSEVVIKAIKIMSFDIEFVSNISLPDYIGLGKNSSINYGTITRIKTK